MTDPDPLSAPDSSKRKRPTFVAILAVILVIAGAVMWFRPTSASALLEEAQHALDAGHLPQAIDKARRAVELDPASTAGWSLLAQAAWLSDDGTTWEQAVHQLEQLDSSSAFELCLKIGSHEMQRLRAADAERALHRAVAINPDRPEPWRLLNQLLSVQGRPHENAECLLSLIRLGDFTSTDLHTLVWPNAAVFDPDRAQALLEADPKNRIPRLAFVGAALNENRPDEAERLLGQILAQHPDHPRTIAILGLLLAERDAPEFLNWQTERSSAATTEPETWLARGIWLNRHGQTAAAVRCFHQAFVRDPRNSHAVSELGQSLQSLGEPTTAAEFLQWARLQQEVIELSRRVQEGQEPRDLRSLVEHLEQIGRLWEAWAWCRAYQHAWPGDSFASHRLAHLQSHLSPGLPRTVPTSVPGRDFHWSNLAEPMWPQAASAPSTGPDIAGDASLQFVDDSDRVGIHFEFENGPATGQTMVQTSGGGVAAFDYDRDGWCDLYFTQGGEVLDAQMQSAVDVLYRNIGGERFQAVTLPANLHEDRFSQGIAAGDFDNDGFPDLYVANLGQNRLWRNNGDGTFSDMTDSAGLTRSGWTTSCAMADLNGDGNPELFSVCYAGGPEITTRVCRDQSGRPSVCRPTLFPAEEDFLALSDGHGQFRELSREVGIETADGRGFGLVVADFDDDRRLDVFIANDQTANFLLIQQDAPEGELRFADQAVISGVAFDRDGFPQACMGVASGEINHDGRTDLFITNFADESNTLYLSQAYGGYQDTTRTARLRDPSYPLLGFGTQFLDADRDGVLDLLLLNGHIHDPPEPDRSQAMRPQLFRGLSDGSFAEVTDQEPTSFLNTPRIGRGLCTLDWNRDGIPDFAASFLEGRAVLGTNRSPSDAHWLTLELIGVKSSRDAIGTRVRMTLPDGTNRWWESTAGDGFAASNERRLHIGLGEHSHVATLEIHWPSGAVQRFEDISGDKTWIAIEGASQLRAKIH